MLIRSDVRDFQVDDQGVLSLRDGADDAAWRAVSSVKHRIIKHKDVGGTVEIVREIEFRLWDKTAAIGLAGKHLRLFVERHEVTGKDGAPITVRVEDVRERIAGRLARLASCN